MVCLVDEYEKQTGISIPIHGPPPHVKALQTTELFPFDSRCRIWGLCRTFCLSRIQVGL